MNRSLTTTLFDQLPPGYRMDRRLGVVYDAPPSVSEEDLSRIQGIGTREIAVLNRLGVFVPAQIAMWSPRQLQTVAEELSVPVSIPAGQQWISQAQRLCLERPIPQPVISEEPVERHELPASVMRTLTLLVCSLLIGCLFVYWLSLRTTHPMYGILSADITAIRVPTDARLTATHVRAGDEVFYGDNLLTLEKAEHLELLQRQELLVQTLERKLHQAEAQATLDLEWRRREVERELADVRQRADSMSQLAAQHRMQQASLENPTSAIPAKKNSESSRNPRGIPVQTASRSSVHHSVRLAPDGNNGLSMSDRSRTESESDRQGTAHQNSGSAKSQEAVLPGIRTTPVSMAKSTPESHGPLNYLVFISGATGVVSSTAARPPSLAIPPLRKAGPTTAKRETDSPGSAVNSPSVPKPVPLPKNAGRDSVGLLSGHVSPASSGKESGANAADRGLSPAGSAESDVPGMAAAADLQAECRDVAVRLQQLEELKSLLPEQVRVAAGVENIRMEYDDAVAALCEMRSLSRDVSVLCPGHGRVGQIRSRPGDQMSAGEVLLRILHTDRRYVMVHVPTHRMNEIEPGTLMNLTFPGNAHYRGRVSSLPMLAESPRPDGETVATVRVEPVGKLWPEIPIGSRIEATICAPVQRHAEALPHRS